MGEILGILKAGGLSGGLGLIVVLLLWKMEKHSNALTKVITELDKRVIVLEVKEEERRDVR